jgi:formate hydrogenlyase transcriptional activator
MTAPLESQPPDDLAGQRLVEQLRAELAGQQGAVQAAQERGRLFVRLGQWLASTLELRPLFQHVADELHALTGCDQVNLIRVRREEQLREGFAVEFTPTRRWIDLDPQGLAGSAAEWVLHHRRTRLARRLDQVRPFVEDRTLFAEGYRCYLYLPLICRNQGVAVLGLASRVEEAGEKWDQALLREVGGFLALAVEHEGLGERLARLEARSEDERHGFRDALCEAGVTELIGESRAMQEVRRAIAQVAPTDSTVLIQGETGTGKELVARAIHEQSARRDHLLVAVHCAALAPGILASELFGHEPGAFTGATRRRIGRFELAQQGSLFLDEVGEIAPDVQVLLLRALQERIIERVGGNEQIPVDVRILAATNRDLGRALADGSFREDLFYRLNVFPIRVPPLRERRDDIPALIEHFIARCERRMNKPVAGISQRTLDLALAYSWPGNVRELENLVERAMIVTAGDTLEIDPAWLTEPPRPQPAEPPPPITPAVAPSLAEQERRAILDALERCQGRIYGPQGAAVLLGLKPTTLYGKMRRHGIRKTGPARYT